MFLFFIHQIIIQQLKDKLESTKQQIENKTTDIKINSEQLKELKSQLTDLIDSCEKLYLEYDVQRIQVGFIFTAGAIFM